MSRLAGLGLVGLCLSACDGAGSTAGDVPPLDDVSVDTPTQAEMDAVLERARAEVAAERAQSDAQNPKSDAVGAGAVVGEAPRETSSNGEADPGEGANEAAPAGDDLLAGLEMLNLRSLSESHRKKVFNLLESEASACGKSHSLRHSLRNDPKCVESIAIAQWIVDTVRQGRDGLSIRQELGDLVRGLQPTAISVGSRPSYGPSQAPVTVVVFADFECAHCALEAPRLRKAIDAANGKARLVYKHYPLSHHAGAKRAADASEAVFAQKPDAFWDFQAWIFEQQRDLFADPDALDAKLRARAEKLGIDLARYDGWVKDQRGRSMVESDHADGRRAGVTGTPAIFVNGRRVRSQLFYGSIAEWIDFALRLEAR